MTSSFPAIAIKFTMSCKFPPCKHDGATGGALTCGYEQDWRLRRTAAA